MSKTLTPNLKLPLVDGSDLVSKENINNALNVLDENALKADHVLSKAHFEMWEKGKAYQLLDTVRTTTSLSWMIYVCISPGISGADEPDLHGVGDTCVDGTVTWQLRSIGDEGLVITDWAASHKYSINDYCILNKVLYRCIANHTSGAAFSPSAWKAVSQDIIPFVEGRDYEVGDIVLYQDRLYRCTVAGTSVPMFIPSDWAEISGGTSFIEDWKPSTDYERDQIVLYDGCLYRARYTSFTSGAAFNADNWQKVGNPTINGFAGNAHYLADEPVVYEGILYRAKSAFTSGSAFDEADWNRVDALALIKDWATATKYHLDEVVIEDGILYRCVTAHTSTTFAGDKSNWEAVAGGQFTEDRKHLAEDWKPSTAYVKDEVIVQDDKLYRCKTAHTSGALFDTAEVAMWEMIGGGGSETTTGLSVRSWVAGEVYLPHELLEADENLYMVLEQHTSTDISADMAERYIKKINGGSAGGGGGIALASVSNIIANAESTRALLRWTDPPDVVFEGATLAAWAGTLIVRKIGSAPENKDDGTLVIDSKSRNAYVSTSLVDSGLTNGITYYYSFFPYTKAGVYTEDGGLSEVIPNEYKIMTVRIDLTNSNPETALTYDDNAVELTPGSAEWDDFFGHYPVLLKDGVEVGKLDPNNFDQFEDGTPVDITSGDAGDVMIAFPRRGVSITTIGTEIVVSMTDNPNNGNFKYYAHTRGETPKDVFYLGAYRGTNLSEKLRSLKFKPPKVDSTTLSKVRDLARANGDGYCLSAFYQLTFRQCMYILKYKNLNSQEVIGYGRVHSSNRAYYATGGTETWGMDCELIKETNPTYMTDQTSHVKCFGIEDCWGNGYELVDGIYYSSGPEYCILTSTDPDGFNLDGTGYNCVYKPQSYAINYNYLTKPVGTTEGGFITTDESTGGSSTTFFCDASSQIQYNNVGACAGDYADGTNCGAFLLCLSISPTAMAVISPRLMVL